MRGVTGAVTGRHRSSDETALFTPLSRHRSSDTLIPTIPPTCCGHTSSVVKGMTTAAEATMTDFKTAVHLSGTMTPLTSTLTAETEEARQ